MPNDKLVFAFSLSILLLAACSSRGETEAENDGAEAETNALANEKGPHLRNVNGADSSQGNEVAPPNPISYLPDDDAIARPQDARTFCAKSRDTDAEVEQDADTLPRDVKQVGAGAWRCMNHKAMVCDLGATGMGCLRTWPVDSERLEAFKQFCLRNPDSNHIPHSLTIGLASEWRCDYTTPVHMNTSAIDSRGYFKHSWRVLN